MSKFNNPVIYGLRGWFPETDPVALEAFFNTTLRNSGHTILNYTEHHFKPQGFTALWLLSESHFAIHTFPEANKTYIGLSSCCEKSFDSFVRDIGREGFEITEI